VEGTNMNFMIEICGWKKLKMRRAQAEGLGTFVTFLENSSAFEFCTVSPKTIAMVFLLILLVHLLFRRAPEPLLIQKLESVLVVLSPSSSSSLRIINGTEADELRYPNVVSISHYPDKPHYFFCGGSFIAPDVILSAAHCNCF
jgi:hypothetical protein